MGARISGIGSNMIRVDGVEALHGAEHRISTDHVDIGTFAVAAAVTGGDITIRNFVPDHFEMVGLVLRRMGVQLETGDDTLHVLPSELRGHSQDGHRSLARLSYRPGLGVYRAGHAGTGHHPGPRLDVRRTYVLYR